MATYTLQLLGLFIAAGLGLVCFGLTVAWRKACVRYTPMPTVDQPKDGVQPAATLELGG